MIRIRYHDVLARGRPIAVIEEAEPAEVERWVRSVSDESGFKLDWEFRGGVPHVLFGGRKGSAFRDATMALYDNKESLNGKLEVGPLKSPKPTPSHRIAYLPRPL